MLEAFVIALCIGDYACNDAIKAYTKTPAGQTHTRDIKKFAHQYVDKQTITTFGIFIAAASNKKAKVRITRNMLLEGNKDEIGVTFRYDF